MKIKIVVITLLALGLFAVIGLLVGRHMVIGYLTPEFLVEQIESRWNCRAQIESVEANVLGTSKVEIKGLALFPRDEVVEKGGPISDRAVLSADTAAIHAQSVALEVKTADLIARTLRINHLELDGVTANSKVSTDGESSLSQVFRPLEDSSTNPDTTVVTGPVGTDPPIVPPTSVEEETPIEVTDAEKLPMSLLADRLELKNGTVKVFLEASGATVTITDFSVAFTDIDVDPRNLNGHNRSSFQFGGDLNVTAADEADLATAHIGGQGDLKPFNAASGAVDPAWAVDLTMAKGAQINTFPVLEKLQKMLEESDTGGIKLGKLKLRGELTADATTQITQYQGKYRFDKPLILQMPDAGLLIKEKSWIDTGSNLHQLRGSIILSEENTIEVDKMVDQYLASKTKGFRIPGAKQLIMNAITENDRVVLDVVSEGDMSTPKVDIPTIFGNLTEIIDSGKGAIDELEDVGKSLLDALRGK